MKDTILLLLFIALIIGTKAQAPINPGVEIGIVEKLGQTVPLDLMFFNEKNDTVTLGSLVNKPTILSFVYFDCPGLCSPLLDGIADVVGKMDMSLGKDFDIVTISFNTRDTPEKAKQKKLNFVQKIQEKDRGNWTYLTGELESIQKITEAVGFRYKPTGLDFAHPSTIVMLSPSGKITRYLYGVTFLPFDVKMAIGEAQRGLARPTSSKLLDYCFGYDAQSKSYTLQFTRLIGTGMLLVGLLFVIVMVISAKLKSSKATKE